ncbi:MAG TPA: DNA primase [Desulfomonilaceae bacterium]|nr:DNA primase [Desulfomonilaceae bacterium]
MRIPESTIAEVAAAADIVQVISGYVDLKKAGKDYRGLCPFHGEKAPSFYVSPAKGIFHCFGCATGGSVFNFIMKIENISFVEAVRLLARRYGITLPTEVVRSGDGDERSRLLKIVQAAQAYFRETLNTNLKATEYLINRGVPHDWLDRIGFGFARDSWDGMERHLRKLGVNMRDAAGLGLVRQRENGGYYDYFRSRVTIPIWDLGGHIVGFGGRAFGNGEPKYLNSPDSPLFRKRNILYGLDAARNAIRSEGAIVIVEGYFDQISLRIRGLEHVVAPLGTSLALEQVKLIKRYTTEVITVFDGDDAGLSAVRRSIPLFLAEGIEARCLILKEDKDPDEAVNKRGLDAFRKMLDQAVPAIDFFLNSLHERYNLHGIQGRNLALEECLPILREIADSKERDYVIERFASRLRVREDRIRRLMGSVHVVRRQGDPRSQEINAGTSRVADAEGNVVRGMLVREGFIDTVIESGLIKDFENPFLKSLAQRMVEHRERMGTFDPFSFCSSIDDHRLAATVAGWLEPRPEVDDLRPEDDGDRVIDESVDRLRLRRLERRKSEIVERMKQCRPDEDEYNVLAKELWSLGRRLHK